MKKATIIALVCIFAAAGAALAKGKGYGGMGGTDLPPGKWWKVPDIKTKLQLTPDEEQQLEGLYVETRRRMIDLKATLEKEMLELGELLDQEALDESVCMDRFMKVQDAKTNLAAERFKAVIEARKILGNDRFQQLKSEFKQRRASKIGKRGKMRKEMGSQ